MSRPIYWRAISGDGAPVARYQRGNRAARLGTVVQVGHDPVPVAPVRRLDELHDLAVLVAAEALEEEGRRVERDAARRRFLLSRHRRLDRLDAAGDDDAVALPQELVEGARLEVGRGEARHERLRHVQGLD